MPISEDEFKSGKLKNRTEDEILRFLRRHPDFAYKADEIGEAIGYNLDFENIPSFFYAADLSYILNSMFLSGKISKKQIRMDCYYMAKSNKLK